jgi:hypothetical protein
LRRPGERWVQYDIPKVSQVVHTEAVTLGARGCA